MILIDTSVWIEHLRVGSKALTAILDRGEALGHPFIAGELAMGNMAQRTLILGSIRDLPQAQPATDAEVLALIERERLFGLGIGFVDAHLLASARLSGSNLWSLDKRLAAVAGQLGVAWEPAP